MKANAASLNSSDLLCSLIFNIFPSIGTFSFYVLNVIFIEHVSTAGNKTPLSFCTIPNYSIVKTCFHTFKQ